MGENNDNDNNNDNDDNDDDADVKKDNDDEGNSDSSDICRQIVDSRWSNKQSPMMDFLFSIMIKIVKGKVDSFHNNSSSFKFFKNVAHI